MVVILSQLLSVVEWAGSLVGLPWWASYFVAVAIPTYVYQTWTFGVWKERGVKGPRPWPFMGNFYDIMKNGFTADVERHAKWGRVYGMFQMRVPTLVVSDADIIKEVAIKNFDAFQNRMVDGFPIQMRVPTLVVSDADIIKEVAIKNFDAFQNRMVDGFPIQMRVPTLVVSDADIIKEVAIKNFDAFQNRMVDGFPIQREIRDAVSLKNFDEWKGARNVITPTFSGAKMRRISTIITQCGRDLVTALGKAHDAEVDVKFYAGNFTMDAVARTLFGVEANCQEDLDNAFVRYAKRVFDITFANPKIIAMLTLPKTIIKPIFEALNWGTMDPDVAAFFRRQVESILAMQKANPSGQVDFLQLLMEAHETEMEKEDHSAKVSALESTQETYDQVKDWRVGKRALSDNEILSNAIIFMIVGYETTAAALAWMLHLLAFHPDAQEKLFQEIKDKMDQTDGVIGYEAVSVSSMPYLDQVFCETLRLYPSALRTDRKCNAAATIGDGVRVEPGDVVNFAIYAIHRDPEYWPEPDAFRPERFAPENKDSIKPYSWIPFGVGPRNCIGMRLAIMEAKIGLAYALHNYRFAPGPNSELHPKLNKSGFATPEKKKLPLRMMKRQATEE